MATKATSESTVATIASGVAAMKLDPTAPAFVPASSAANQPPKQASLMGLPLELRQEIYDHLTTWEHSDRPSLLYIDALDVVEHNTPPVPLARKFLTQDARATYSWLFTCRQIFEEGKNDILKSHIIGFKSEKEFSDRYLRDELMKTIRFMAFLQFQLPKQGLRYAKHTDPEKRLANLQGVWIMKGYKSKYERID